MELSGLISMLGSPGVAFAASGLACVLFVSAGVFVVKALQLGQSAKLAKAEAEAKLSAARDLAEEVKRLRAQVEEAVLHHNGAVANAFLMHNEACAATRQRANAALKGGHDDDHHHKHHAAEASLKGGHDDDEEHHHHHAAEPSLMGDHDDEDDHHKHHAADVSLKGGHDDDEDHHKHHAAAPTSFLKSFFARRQNAAH
jgi:hypothetical protein